MRTSVRTFALLKYCLKNLSERVEQLWVDEYFVNGSILGSSPRGRANFLTSRINSPRFIGDEPDRDLSFWFCARPTVNHHASGAPFHKQSRRRISRRVHGADSEKSQSQTLHLHPSERLAREERRDLGLSAPAPEFKSAWIYLAAAAFALAACSPCLISNRRF